MKSTPPNSSSKKMVNDSLSKLMNKLNFEHR